MSRTLTEVGPTLRMMLLSVWDFPIFLVVFPVPQDRGLARHTTADAAQQSPRCPTPGIAQVAWLWRNAVTFLKETQGLLSRFVCVYSGYNTQGDLWIALAGSL
jgi:hypothetical protein